MPLEKKIFYSKTLGIFKKASVLTLFSFINSPKKKQKLTEGKITNIQFSNNLCFIDFGFKAEIEIFFNEYEVSDYKYSSETLLHPLYIQIIENASLYLLNNGYSISIYSSI
jgi:hypothetical protein